jgi:3-oxoacyl-[acyl-carrier-protein] synthase III
MGAKALRRAMESASCREEDLALVLFVGVSRDYLPSWSTATEVMRLVGIPGSCLGLDLQAGCLGLLPALEIADGWLKSFPGRHAAIVAAERWSYTVSRGDTGSMGMWAHSDGAGALIVTRSSDLPTLGTFRGARYLSWSEDNDLILVKYGGTRFPTPPPGANPFHRSMANRDYAEPMKLIIQRHMQVMKLASEDLGLSPETIVCNQISPRFINELASSCGLDPSAICATGHENGHIGAADPILGIHELQKTDGLHGDILVAASTPYAVGVGAVSASSGSSSSAMVR